MPLASDAGMPSLGVSKQMDVVKKLTRVNKAPNMQALACSLLSHSRETHTEPHMEPSSRDRHTCPAVPTALPSPSQPCLRAGASPEVGWEDLIPSPNTQRLDSVVSFQGRIEGFRPISAMSKAGSSAAPGKSQVYTDHRTTA